MDLEILNTQLLSSYGGNTYNCRCGQHSIKTLDIVFSSDPSSLSSITTKYVAVHSKIVVFCEEENSQHELLATLHKSFRLEIIVLPLNQGADNAPKFGKNQEIKPQRNQEATSAPQNDSGELSISLSVIEGLRFAEDTKLVLAFGGEIVARFAKFVAYKNRLPVGIFAFTPSCNYLVPSSALVNNGVIELFRTNYPLFVVLDINIVGNATDKYLASAFGEIVSKKIALFDWYMSHIMCGEPYCSDINELLGGIIDSTIISITDKTRHSRQLAIVLAENCLRISAICQMTEGSRLNCGGNVQVLHALTMLYRHEQRHTNLDGENLYIISKVLAKFYLNFVEKYDATKFAPPPNNNMRIEKMAELFGLDEVSAAKRVQPYTPPKVLNLQIYRLKEYTRELKSRCHKLDCFYSSVATLFRRMYDDDGYRLQEYITNDEMALAIALAPDIRDKFTTLSFMKQVGILDCFLE